MMRRDATLYCADERRGEDKERRGSAQDAEAKAKVRNGMGWDGMGRLLERIESRDYPNRSDQIGSDLIVSRREARAPGARLVSLH